MVTERRTELPENVVDNGCLFHLQQQPLQALVTERERERETELIYSDSSDNKETALSNRTNVKKPLTMVLDNVLQVAC